jgi:hypothetical protein
MPPLKRKKLESRNRGSFTNPLENALPFHGADTLLNAGG